VASSPLVQAPVRAAAGLVRMASSTPPTGLLRALSYEVDEREGELALAGGTTRVRWYVPRGVTDAPGLVLVHGIHRLGVDEPRLIAFSRAIASAGVVVLAPHVAELADYRIDVKSVATIGAAADELARATGRARVGVMGLSFAGGLAILAAADPHAGAHVGFVVSVGGHHDLARVLRFFARSEAPSPEGIWKLRAHDYGVLVLAYRYVEDFFLPGDVEVARDCLRTWLWGDKPAAVTRASALSPEGRAKMQLFFDQREDLLSADLLATTARHEAAMGPVSPRTRLGDVHVPVFLLHGELDDVIPSSEARWIAHDLPPSTPRELLVTPALGHVELVGTPTVRARIALVRFMAGVLHAALEEPR
jgi:pimeloyl-ACP methyl ester carboxylesterase